MSAASTSTAIEMLPVHCLTPPISTGPISPARLAALLIRAMPPAAAVPARMRPGSPQNMASVAISPDTPMVRNTIAATVLCGNSVLAHMPAAATNIGIAVCSRRSPLRSACAALRFITTQATP